MSLSFDLTSRPWIPCITSGGSLVELSLSQVFANAHSLRELGGESPMVTAALYRLLLAILHRLYEGPEDDAAWGALWRSGRFDAAATGGYLAHWQERFDLFHARRPFYQMADSRVKPKSVTSLIHDVASGNNATLFDHHTDEQGLALTPAQAARYLVAAQAFGLAGLSGLPEKFTYAPCVGGALFLVQGETLFQTLLLNLIVYDDYSPMPRRASDAPAWEQDDPFAARTTPLGYLDYLTWQNRRIFFLPEPAGDGAVVRQMTMAPGLRIEGVVLNPLMHYRVDEKRGHLALRFSEARALWRDSAALFRLRNEGHRPPLAFDWLAEVEGKYLQPGFRRRILALGMANDQAKVEFFRTERMPLRSEYLQQKPLVDKLEDLLTLAEDVARQLWAAASTLARIIVAPDQESAEGRKAQPEDVTRLLGAWGVERAYWSQLETPFRHVLETLPDDPDGAVDAWQSTLRRAAWTSFDAVGDNLDPSPRALKALVNARGQLGARLAKVIPAST